MERITASYWRSLTQWSPTAFLVAGGLLLGHATVTGIQAFTNMTPPMDVFASVGHLLALVGLVGLYTMIADHTPLLAQVGSVLAGVVAVGWAAVTVSILATALVTLPPQVEAVIGVFSALVLVSTALPYVLFGVLSLRFEAVPRRVGLFLLTPAVLLVALLVDIVVLGASPLDGVVVGTGLAVSMLAAGYTLRVEELPTGNGAVDGDVTPG